MTMTAAAPWFTSAMYALLLPNANRSTKAFAYMVILCEEFSDDSN